MVTAQPPALAGRAAAKFPGLPAGRHFAYQFRTQHVAGATRIRRASYGTRITVLVRLAAAGCVTPAGGVMVMVTPTLPVAEGP